MRKSMNVTEHVFDHGSDGLLIFNSHNRKRLERTRVMDEVEKDESSANHRIDNMRGRTIRRMLDQATQAHEFGLASELETKRQKLNSRHAEKLNLQALECSENALESLHENLLTLNSQLHDLLEQQAQTGHLLQSLFFSTNVAVVCLDLDLKVSFFTPAANSIFLIRPTDVERPLSDLQWLAADPDLLRDAENAVSNQTAQEREIVNAQGRCYKRRTEPYRNHRNEVDGVIISYADVTDQNLAVQAQRSAVEQLQQTRFGKTRFLSAVSDDLRQPLQTLALSLNLLARDEKRHTSSALIATMEHSVRTMSDILNTMLDIDQIEAGVISFELEDIHVHELLQGVCSEFEYQVEANSLELKVVRSSAVIRADRRFFQRIVRGLLANAIRCIGKGRISVGCRRRGDRLRIEVWEAGTGAPAAELEDIFNDERQAKATSRTEPDLGLSIVQRLADLLGYQIRVSSKVGYGSVFSVDVPLAEIDLVPQPTRETDNVETASALSEKRAGEIFIVDDDPDCRNLLELLLSKQGHSISKARDLTAALALLGSGKKLPDLLIVDFNLPGQLDGCGLARIMISSIGVKTPAIILTDAIAAETRKMITALGFTPIDKPVRPEILEDEINRLLQRAEPNRSTTRQEALIGSSRPRVVIVDDHEKFNEILSAQLTARGYSVTSFSCGATFLSQLADLGADGEAICFLVGAYLGSIDGLSIVHTISELIPSARVIMVTGASDVQLAVRALKGGVIDFFEKPIDFPELVLAIDEALKTSRDRTLSEQDRAEAASALSNLTPREQDVLKGVLAGRPNKNIAADLGISQRTVESHRASVMAKTNCRTLPELVRLAIRASWPNGPDICPALDPNGRR